MRKLVITFIVCFLICNYSFGANLAVNAGFETQETTSGGWPSSYGDWDGDYSAIVGVTSGIAPCEGNKMLQFQGSYDFGVGSKGASEIFQLIDTSAYKSQIELGNSSLKASAFFNRVTFDNQTDTEFRMFIGACQGTPSLFTNVLDNNSFLANSGYLSFYSDSDVTTWEKFEIQINLPVNTDYVFVMIAASENIYNDYSSPEFDGHFADAVSVEIIPEPMTMGLLAVGSFFLRKRHFS